MEAAKRISREELLERIFQGRYEDLKDQRLRFTRVSVPGKEVTLAHVIGCSLSRIYENLGLHIGTHEGEDHTGEAIGILRFGPWEVSVAAADVAVKAAHVDIGFMDRFCGTLILTGAQEEVRTAVKEVLRYFGEELHFPVCQYTEQ